MLLKKPRHRNKPREAVGSGRSVMFQLPREVPVWIGWVRDFEFNRWIKTTKINWWLNLLNFLLVEFLWDKRSLQISRWEKKGIKTEVKLKWTTKSQVKGDTNNAQTLARKAYLSLAGFTPSDHWKIAARVLMPAIRGWIILLINREERYRIVEWRVSSTHTHKMCLKSKAE